MTELARRGWRYCCLHFYGVNSAVDSSTPLRVTDVGLNVTADGD